jgi:hypothetical protein
MRFLQPLAAIGGGLVVLSYAALAAAADGAPAADVDESGKGPGDLAKAVQNPVADMISVPFQNTTNYNIGPNDRAQDTLKIEPVLPLHLSERLMVITRTIVPIVYQPDVNNTGGGSSGLGDVNPAFYLSPAKPGRLIYGVGPIFTLPTATQRTTGSGKLTMGPAAVALIQPGHWTFGALVSQIWSVAGPNDRSSVSLLSIQYFVHYNLPEHWYLSTAPTITANLTPTGGGGDQWTIPFGGGVGKIFKLGPQHLNGKVEAYYNLRPDNNDTIASWQMLAQVAFLFPLAKPAATARR